jgi:hypothetical protein
LHFCVYRVIIRFRKTIRDIFWREGCWERWNREEYRRGHTLKTDHSCALKLRTRNPFDWRSSDACIPEVLISNLSRETCCPHRFLSVFLRYYFKYIRQPSPILSKSFQIRHSSIILPLDAAQALKYWVVKSPPPTVEALCLRLFLPMAAYSETPCRYQVALQQVSPRGSRSLVLKNLPGSGTWHKIREVRTA